MGVEDRLRRLERSVSETTEPERSEAFTHLKDLLNELAYLRQSSAPGLRGGVPIEPANIPRKILGPTYTHRQLLELAVRRSVEHRGVPAECRQQYLECLCEVSRNDLDAVVEETV